MPNYEYECTRCGYSFEIFQKITELPLKKCPKCNCTLKRLIGAGSGIIFKGQGFYATDYRKKSHTSEEDKHIKENKPSTDKKDVKKISE